ncbi:MAG: transposase [Chlorobiaceae bacterium]|nr:transposase [Chlorobiaceae bacterium]
MKRTRRIFSAEFKTKVVLEALSERLTLTELGQKHEIHPNQITQWKREFLEKASDVFSKGDKAQQAEQDHQHRKTWGRCTVSEVAQQGRTYMKQIGGSGNSRFESWLLSTLKSRSTRCYGTFFVCSPDTNSVGF